MKYKALMLDVDGTIVPYDFQAVPSDAVTTAIQKAQEKLTVCLVTGRSYVSLEKILEKLQFDSGYLVADNGARIMDLATKEIIYERTINPKDIDTIAQIFWDENVEVYIKDDMHTGFFKDPHKKGDTYGKVYNFYIHEDLSEEKVDRLHKNLSKIPGITPYKSKHAHGYGVNVQHVQATKLHGVEIVMKQLGIQRKQIVACGDSYNDFPLLMAAGFKVAMGNAISDLKEIADYVAPSVYDDGVAEVIEKFILSD